MCARAAANKALVLIDGSNLFHSFSQVGTRDTPYRIDFNALMDLLKEEVGTIEKVCYFSAEPPDGTLSPTRKKYLQLLKRMGFDVRTVMLRGKTTTCKVCGKDFSTFVEKGLDVALTAEALKYGLQGLCDAVVIVSGSSSYMPVIDILQGSGVLAAVAAFKDHCNISLDLVTRANLFVNLSTNVERLRLRPRTDADVSQTAETPGGTKE